MWTNPDQRSRSRGRPGDVEPNTGHQAAGRRVERSLWGDLAVTAEVSTC